MVTNPLTNNLLAFFCLLVLCPTSRTLSAPPTQASLPFAQDSLRKEYIKAQILQRLGLTTKPVVDLSHKLSRDLVLETLRRAEGLEDWEGHPNIVGGRAGKLSDDDDGDSAVSNYAKTSEIISFPDKGPVLNDQPLLSFSFAGSNAFGVGVRVKKAQFWVKLNYESTLGPQFGHVLYPKGVKLYIFQVNGNYSHSETTQLRPQDVTLDLIVSKTISIDSMGWQKLDITSIVQKWYTKFTRHRIRHPHYNHSHVHRGRGNGKLTLLIDCSGCGSSVKPVLFSDPIQAPSSALESPPLSFNELNTTRQGQSSSDELIQPHPTDSMTELPFLVLETESGPHVKRNRRRALECSPRLKQCCKQRFFISFQDLGWEDWIIAPRGYYANYCRGHCGGVHRTPDTFLNYHTHVMEEYRRTAAGQMELAGLTPCCAPTKFSSMSLIYFGPDLNIIKRDLPKMIVEECGCP